MLTVSLSSALIVVDSLPTPAFYAAIGGGIVGGVLLLIVAVVMGVCIGKRQRARSSDSVVAAAPITPKVPVNFAVPHEYDVVVIDNVLCGQSSLAATIEKEEEPAYGQTSLATTE